MTAASPQALRAAEGLRERARRATLDRRAMAARDGDMTPQMRAALARVHAERRARDLEELAGRDRKLAREAQAWLEAAYDDPQRALELAREARESLPPEDRERRAAEEVAELALRRRRIDAAWARRGYRVPWP